jgi:Ca2+-binding RTX toxin-like protein
MIRRVLVVLVTAAGVLIVAPTASALTKIPVWKCRASPTYTSIAGNNRLEPVVANGNINTANGVDPDRAQCVNSETGAGNLATQVGIPQDFIGAGTAQAVTHIDPELGKAIDQVASSTARVENLSIRIPAGGSILLGVGVASSSVVGRCVKGSKTPQLIGTSNVATVTLGGQAINLDNLLNAINQLLAPLQQIAALKLNEEIKTSTSLTRRALHLIILPQAGGAPLVDQVLGESKVAFDGPVCDPDKQGDDGEGPGPVCPPGSQLDIPRNLCIIPAGTGGSSSGEIIVGLPYQGPSGGTVLPIDVARRRYGNSPCLGFSGNPKFAIVGTNKADRITGTNIADRIIGLGGNDKLDGGRGNDCIEGRTGGDNISGALGNDKLYGSVGNDHLNGGPGTDYESAGSGNDTINAAFGRDRALGGSGRDFINVATAGPSASVDCGPGPDKARINSNERKRVKHCEVVHVFTSGG